MRLAKVLGGIGRTFVTAGVLILLFVVYQLWGTGIRHAQSQDRLGEEFAELLDAADDVPATTSTTEPSDPAGSTTSTTAPVDTAPPLEPVPQGTATAHIRIPKIGVDETVIEGVSLANLKHGPGHFPETPLPGQKGNAAIAGHRTTYGAPFNRIDELEPGDEIFVQTVQGEFRYTMTEQLIVTPSQVEVLEDKGDNRLTLTACHPKYSARERIVVVAVLDPRQEALPAPPPVDVDEGTGAAPVTFEDVGGEPAPVWPAIVLALLCAAIWVVAWLLGKVWRTWPAYAVSLPFFLVNLFFFFEEFSRVLPSSY